MNPTITQEINALRDFLDQSNELGIIIGLHQNLDTVSSALALYLSLTQAGKKVQIISKKQPTVEISNLVGVDKIKDGFVGNTGKLIVSLPYVKGEVEKVLFTEAPNTINFHLTAAPDRSITPFDVNDVKLIWEGGAPEAVITFGVGTPDELNGIIDTNSSKIVNIDNYPGNTRFGDVVLVDESFSSLSEIVGKVLKDLQFPMDMDIAQNILDGVLFATRNFTKQNTSPLAFEAASAAMYHGAQRKLEEQQGRREQGMNPQRSQQNQDRNRGEQQRNPQHGRQRGASFSSQRGSTFDSQRSSTFDSQRVNDTDFPAMHMQNNRGQNQQQESRRDNQMRAPQPQNPPRMSQQFAGNEPQRTQDIREKIMRETRPSYEPQDRVEDAQLVNEPSMQSQQPVEDTRMPQEPSFENQNNEEIPDDWLMPKVFKSSKNNN